MTEAKKDPCAWCELLVMQADVPKEQSIMVAFCLGKVAERAPKLPPLCTDHEVVMCAVDGMLGALAKHFMGQARPNESEEPKEKA